MPGAAPGTARLLLVGTPGSEFHLAAAMVRETGAEVAMADTVTAALASMRAEGADLAMVDVGFDIAGFIEALRRERMALPVYACGIDATATRAAAAIRCGARDYLPLPPDRELIAAAILAVAGDRCTIIGEDAAYRRAHGLGLAMAPARAPFLIAGEPGSGKALLARAVHAASQRRGRFVEVDCVAIDPEMLDSELFGHEAGAFAGAVARRRGRIEDAADGTLYLREVALLPAATQTRLAQLLAGQAPDRPAAGAGAPLAARIVAGTAFDLDARVADGRFRANLLAGLGLVRLAVPPLRRRGADIGRLAAHFADHFARANNLPARPLAPATLDLLGRHDWPGNVAELEDVIHRAVFLACDAAIEPAAIVLADGSALSGARSRNPAGRVDGLVGSTVEAVERDLILETLKACRGNRTSASTILGISVRTMRNKLKSFIEAGVSIAANN